MEDAEALKKHAQFTHTFIQVSNAVSRYYQNSTSIMTISGQPISVADIIAAAVLSQTDTYLMGTKGEGKTLIAEIVQRSVMNDDALYLRGDKDLSLKDIMVKLNLDGKTDDEIFQVSENIRRPFFLVDELNRCLGLMQNQFLNIADGYIEIRGKKYYLGHEGDYSIMFATGNPPREGDYTGVFDEDIALLDRVGLILNVDDYPLTELDTLEITERRINKRGIELGDLRGLVFEGNRAMRELAEDFVEFFGIITSYVYNRMLKMEVGGTEVNKRQVTDWRSAIESETHASGDILSYASDVSQRAVQSVALAEALLLYRSGLKMAESGETEDIVSPQEIIDCYLETLVLGLRYDRRFIPWEYVQENFYGNTNEFLKKVKGSLRNEMDPEKLMDCVSSIHRSKRHFALGQVDSIKREIELMEESNSPLSKTGANILKMRMRREQAGARRKKIEAMLGKMKV